MTIVLIIIMAILIIILFCPSKNEKFKTTDNLLCGVKDDKLWCSWENNDEEPKWNQIMGKIKRVFLTRNNLNEHQLYALDEFGSLYYRDDYVENYNNPSNWYLMNKPGMEFQSFNDISVDNNLICGIVNNEIYKDEENEENEENKENKDDEENEDNIKINKYAKNKVICYDRNIVIDPKWEEISTIELPKGSELIGITIKNDKIFILTKNNQLYYKKNMLDKNEEWKLIDAKLFEKIRFDGNLICGVDGNGNAYCYDGTEENLIISPDWKSIKDKNQTPIKFRDIIVKNKNLLGISSDNKIYRVDNYSTNTDKPNWKQINNATGMGQIDVNL